VFAGIVILGSSLHTVRASGFINLVANPSLESSAVLTSPDHWTFGGYGTNTRTAAYPVAGLEGGTAVQVSITAITPDTTDSDGDAKWIFEAIPVESGGLYSFSDWYKSDTPSTLVAAYTYTDASLHFSTLVTVPASGNVWEKTSLQFTAPLGATSVTVYHLISSIGSLTTDNYLLEESAPASETLFPNRGIVSITFDDGWATQYDNAFPMLMSAHLPASFYLITQAVEEASYDFFTDPNEAIVTTLSPDTMSVQWSEIYLDPANTRYRFTDSYTSASVSTLSVTYTDTNNILTTFSVGPIDPGINARVAFNLTIPLRATGTPVTIIHTSTSALVVTTPSLTGYSSGYMNREQVLDLTARGYEIGGHTVHHCNLVQLPNDVGSCPFVTPVDTTTAQSEIEGSGIALRALGITPVDTFAYPNGGHNSVIESLMAGAGFVAARTVEAGYNTRFSEKYALKTQVIDSTTTPAMIHSWIDTAANNRLWLILVFHQIDDPVTITSNGEEGGTTPLIFQDTVSYLSSAQIAITNPIVVNTVHDVISSLANAPIPMPGNTAPHITLSGDETLNLIVGGTFTDPGATAVDAEDGEVTSAITTTGTVDTLVANTYTIVYRVTDSTGFTALARRTIIVTSPVINTPPVITLTGEATINLTVGDIFTDPGATATDVEDGNGLQVVATGVVDTSIATTYTISYSVIDSGGLSAVPVIRTVLVSVPQAPNQTPVVTLSGAASMIVTLGNAFTDPGATATDVEDGIITNAIVVTGGVNTAVLGTYTLTYSVTDSGGLSAVSISRTVTVTAPVVSGGGGGGGGGGNIYYPPVITSPVVPVLTPTTTSVPTAVIPEVKGAPSDGKVLGVSTCAELLTKDLKFHGPKNDESQVKKLQLFLNSHLGTKLPTTGLYGTLTRDAVNKFQIKYKENILTPLKLKNPTGNVYSSTRKTINSINCTILG
jgi:peptidoglycan/xylan/chitin deacetylase (PgdA/CDA1 family)